MLVGLPAVAAEPTLTVSSTRVLPLSPALVGGRVEHRALALHGVPVRGATETVRIRPDGTTEVLRSRGTVLTPQLLPHEARIDAAAVPGLLAAHRGGTQTPELEEPARLVYLMILDHPVLAWEAQQALDLWPEPTRPTVWLSAATGRVLREVEQVRSSRARIFAQNPAATPEPVEIELRDIDFDEAGLPLVGPRVQAFNCVGEEPEEVSPWWEEDECWPLQTVFSDESGDFIVPTPEVVYEEQNVQGSDPYAELSMYAHAEIFLDAMRDRGIEQFQCEQSTMLANFRGLEPTGALDYEPLNNAYYTNQCDAERGPTMIFGQGTAVDFGYDADVIYHELGHGMVALLSPEGLFGRRLRPDASLVDAGGINEALADYFSVMLTDDPDLAEYVGRFWSSIGRPYIRDAENTRTCPGDMIGQVHNDGEPFMAALWATRKRLDDDGKWVLDRIVIEALMRMPQDCDLERATELLLEQAQAEVSVGTWSSTEMDLMTRAFESRGLLDCPRVLEDQRRVEEEGRTFLLRRFDAGVSPFYPGPIQMRYEVPEGAEDMVVSATISNSSDDDPVDVRVLVKRGDMPIEFEYRLVAVDDPPIDPPEDEDPGDPVRELTLVTGDWDLELQPVEIASNDYVATLGGLEPGEVVHVMLVNMARSEGRVSGLYMRSSNEVPQDVEDEPTGTTGGTGDLPGADVVMPGPGASGCACRSTGGDGVPGPGLWLGALLGALGARRRRWTRRR